MLQLRKIALVIGLYILSLPTSSGEAIQQLTEFLAETDTFRGEFQQTVYDENGEILEVSEGKVALAKPRRFRWQYTRPHPQLILADGKHLWIYDEELLQATASPIEEALGSAPIMLFTGIRSIYQDFEVKNEVNLGELKWVYLVPRAQDMEFHSIRVGLDKAGIKKMELHDHFLQKTVIEFTNINTSPLFPPGYFTFKAPEGVDVAGYPADTD